MKCRCLVLLLILFGAGQVTGQEEDTLPVGAVRARSIAASGSAEAFRPPGEYRVWRYFGKQTTLGQLTSIVRGLTEIDDRSALPASAHQEWGTKTFDAVCRRWPNGSTV